MLVVRCEAVRWVDDDPQPGIVEVVLTDVAGRAWSLIDKAPIHDADGVLRPDAEYPISVGVACEVVERKVDAAGRQIAVIELRWPPVNDVPQFFEVSVDQIETEEASWPVASSGGLALMPCSGPTRICRAAALPRVTTPRRLPDGMPDTMLARWTTTGRPRRSYKRPNTTGRAANPRL